MKKTVAGIFVTAALASQPVRADTFTEQGKIGPWNIIEGQEWCGMHQYVSAGGAVLVTEYVDRSKRIALSFVHPKYSSWRNAGATKMTVIVDGKTYESTAEGTMFFGYPGFTITVPLEAMIPYPKHIEMLIGKKHVLGFTFGDDGSAFNHVRNCANKSRGLNNYDFSPFKF